MQRLIQSKALPTMLVVLLVAPAAVLADFSPHFLTDGSTPAGMAPGAPAGSYPLAGFDNINLYNGNLNFRLPLQQILGRGGARYTMTLPIEQHWQIARQVIGDRTVDYPVSAWWPALDVGYGPGALEGRNGVVIQQCGGNLWGQDALYTLTRLTFTAPDGTEYELRDQNTDGQHLLNPYFCQVHPNGYQGPSRGTVFVSADGTATTFVSDTPIFDSFVEGTRQFPTGDLHFRDGTLYRIEQGQVSWLRDANGNLAWFNYERTLGHPQGRGRITRSTDSLNRQVNIVYASTSAPCDTNHPCDVISFKGFAGAARTLRVRQALLAERLRGDQTLKTVQQLFPETGTPDNTLFNPRVVAEVELPDGRKYGLFYNSYGELARVVLPTGGVVEYDFASGVPTSTSGVLGPMVYRRVTARRVYADGVILEGTMSIPVPLSGPTVAVRRLDPAGAALATENHSFFGGPASALNQGPVDYSNWDEGREYQTDGGDPAGNPLRRTVHTWQQRAAVTWGTSLNRNIPPKDPRITQTDTTLLDGPQAQVSRQTFTYDQFNNRTETAEFDYGAGGPGALVRRTQTLYLVANEVSSDYTAPPIHLRSLPRLVTISGPSGATVSQTEFKYDQWALAPRSSISGHVSSALLLGFEATPPAAVGAARGNLTTTRRWLNTDGTWIETKQEYDIAGNVTKQYDANGNPPVTLDYADSFCTVGAELGSQITYAFPTTVTNPLGHPSRSTYDYYLGKPCRLTDPNGVETSLSYSEPLDRLTQIIRGNNQGATVRRQNAFSYPLTSGARTTITTTADQNTFADGRLKSEVVYEGLGRQAETRQYEAAGFIAVCQGYDAMGRPAQVSNPDRATTAGSGCSLASPKWTTTAYDGLSRVVSITSPGGAQTRMQYAGNQTTLTDPALVVRRNLTDALGRLSQVTEDPSGLNYQTSYSYDALDNLTQVNQGGQTRTFVYDSLSRLTSANNPEGGAVNYVYDKNGNLTQRTDARSKVATFSYDALNRIQRRTYSDTTPGPVDYAYDMAFKGRPDSVISPVATYRYEQYDALGRVKRSSQVVEARTFTLSYEYDLAGSLKSQTYPSGRVVTTTYDVAGRPATLAAGSKTYADLTASDAYAPHGAIAKVKLGNNLWERAGFNDRLQTTSIALGTSPSDASRLQLSLDYGAATANNGNVLNQSMTVPVSLTQSYTYDKVNRLQQAMELGYWSQTYGYDRWGNRAVTAGWVLNSDLTPQGSNAFDPATNRWVGTGYDAAGNHTSVAGRTFAYDAENRLITASVGTSSYAYDGDGRRVKKVSGGATIYYVYDTFGQLVGEYPGGTMPSATASTASYLTADHLGSTRVVTNQSGAVEGRHDYLPFGEEIPAGTAGRGSEWGGADRVNQLFTSTERDAETGLDYFGARYFSGPQGRFTTPDPLLNSGRPDDPQSWNRYAYAGNNPLRYIDPTGLYKFAVTCAEDDAACKDQQNRFRESLQQLRSAANVLDKKSAERKALESALNKIGEKEGKGATIAFGYADETNGRANLALANPFTNTITFNLSATDTYTTTSANVADPANPRAFTADEAKGFFTAIVGHEGGHLAGNIPLLSRIGIRNYLQSATEAKALYTESTAYQGMRMNDPQGLLWNNSWLLVDRQQLENNRRLGIEQLRRQAGSK